MLRERLQSVGAELIETRERMGELEGRHDKERARLLDIVSVQGTGQIICGDAFSDVATTGAQISNMAEDLKARQAELMDALVNAATKEAEFEALVHE